MNPRNTTVIICCAGMGTRLGIGTTKALVKILDKPLIIKMLEQLDEFDDVRIIIGYQAEKVINVVNRYRKDILYAFNNDYVTTGPATSMWKGLANSRENVIVIDGDLVFEPKSFKEFLRYAKECIAYTSINSDEPVYLNINDNKVLHFSSQKTKYVWPGVVKINRNKIRKCINHVYETIEHNLPIEAFEISAMEIDTQNDYERVLNWVNNNYK